MPEINDGGPAFPSPNAVRCGEFQTNGHAGMSLRAHFAGLAMQAMVQGHFSHYGHDDYWPRDQIAAEAIEMADAMLSALEAKPQDPSTGSKT